MPTPLNHPLPNHGQHDPTPNPLRNAGSRMQEDLAALDLSSGDTLLVLREHMRVSRAPCEALPGLYLPLVTGRYNSVEAVCVTDLYLWHLLRGHATNCAATATTWDVDVANQVAQVPGSVVERLLDEHTVSNLYCAPLDFPLGDVLDKGIESVHETWEDLLRLVYSDTVPN